MKRNFYIYLGTITIAAFLIIVSISFEACSTTRISEDYSTDTIYSNPEGQGFTLALWFNKGPEFNHPIMAVWITDTMGKYIETLYISESIGKGYFDRADKSTGKWQSGKIRRPAALPVWSHKRNIIEKDGLFVPAYENAIPDGISGATPLHNFVLITKTSSKDNAVFDVWFEINQSWDWNQYWTNNKFPDDKEYKTSCQPALVYKARVNAAFIGEKTSLVLIGHSNYNGSDGSINPDLSTITTAKEITSALYISVLKQ